MVSETSFGRRLQAAAEVRGRTQQQIADSIGVGQTSVSKWMRGASTPTLARLPALARCLDVTLDHLVMGAPERSG